MYVQIASGGGGNLVVSIFTHLKSLIFIVTKGACTSFEKAMCGVSDANASIPSYENVDKTPATNSNADAPSTYASKISPSSSNRANFLFTDETVPKDADYDMCLSFGSVQEVNQRMESSLYGYFIGKRFAFLVVEWFVRNNCGKYGLLKVTMNANSFFFFKFSSLKDVEDIIRDGPWMINGIPIFLNKWSPSISLLKEDLSCVPVLVKFQDVPMVVYTPDGFCLISSKIDTPMMLDSYTNTICLES